MFLKAAGIVAALGGSVILAGLLGPDTLLRLLYGSEFRGAAPYFSFYGLSLLIQMFLMIVLFWQLEQGAVRMRFLMIPVLVFGAGLFSLGDNIQGLILAQILASLSYFPFVLFAHPPSRRSLPLAPETSS